MTKKAKNTRAVTEKFDPQTNGLQRVLIIFKLTIREANFVTCYNKVIDGYGGEMYSEREMEKEREREGEETESDIRIMKSFCRTSHSLIGALS